MINIIYSWKVESSFLVLWQYLKHSMYEQTQVSLQKLGRQLTSFMFFLSNKSRSWVVYEPKFTNMLVPSRVKRRFAEGRSCGGSKTTVPLLPCFVCISRLNSCWVWCCKKWLFHNQVDGVLKLHSKSENKSSVNKFLKTKKEHRRTKAL